MGSGGSAWLLPKNQTGQTMRPDGKGVRRYAISKQLTYIPEILIGRGFYLRVYQLQGSVLLRVRVGRRYR
jgi:hypothetical protein